jgi:FKBP-type peptidyl-prolyl cis-trans isomerase FklB
VETEITYKGAKNMKVLVVALLGFAILAGQAVAEEKKEMSEKEKLSYSIGYTQGNTMSDFFKKQSVDVDAATMSDAFKTGITGGKPVMTDQEMRDTLAAFDKKLRAQQIEQKKTEAENNKKAGEAFLEANKKKEGVVTLADGLQYKVLKDGTGEKPKATDKVKVNYVGTFIDGKEFDSSVKRGEPAVFEVDKVIPGWTEVLQLMKAGSKWQVFIPSNLGYGAAGAGPIGPNSTLVFEIELLSIEK